MKAQTSIHPIKNISGTIEVPGSKSYAQRAVALSILSNAEVHLKRLTECDDVNAALKIASALGADVKRNDHEVKIDGHFNVSLPHSINCGEAGLSTRLFSAFSLLTDAPYIVDGEGSIMTRPMDMVVDALEQLGKRVKSNSHKLPLEISGETTMGQLAIDGSTSSQLLTGLLIVAPFLPFDLTISVKDLKSIPYIEMTLEVLKSFGLVVDHDEFRCFKCKGNQQIKEPVVYNVEGDWSGASFLIVAGLIGGDVLLKGLNENSLQADRAMLNVIERVNGNAHWVEGGLYISKGDLKSFNFDATHCPDLFPPLVALAAMINGVSKIKGVHRLKHKESDRATALIKEFSSLGILISRENDELIVQGLKNNEFCKGGNVSAHSDHRMAMALSLMAIRSNEEIVISTSDSISKSYPQFYKDLSIISK